MPNRLVKALSDYKFRRLNRRVDADFAGQSAKQVFSTIYSQGVWGHKTEWEFCSGSGSHDPNILEPYLRAVRLFVTSLPDRPVAVDLGCGDFNVGSQLQPFCKGYIACDIVPALIESNRTRFKALNVDFRCIDAITDDLPNGDIVFLRQVLQHLNNDQISRIVRKLNKYRFLVLTEHLPATKFIPNMEKPTGPGVRIGVNSGIVLPEAPFYLRFKIEEHVCSIEERASRVRTTIYTL
jgi:Methyltransferase domain